MSRTEQRSAAIQSAIGDIRAIIGARGATKESLEEVRRRLAQLASHSELFPAEDFPHPGPGETGNSALYRLQEDADGTFALYINSSSGSFYTPVHNHTTWAVIAGISGGGEQNHFFRRKADGAPERIGGKLVTPGEAVAFLPDEFHAISIDAPLLNFHLYGKGLEQLDAREYYREAEGEWAIFPPHSDIRDARVLN